MQEATQTAHIMLGGDTFILYDTTLYPQPVLILFKAPALPTFVCVCVFVCLFACLFVCLYLSRLCAIALPFRVQASEIIYTHIHTFLRLCILRLYYMYVCMSVCMYAIYVCMHLRTYVHMYVCTYVCVYVFHVYIYIYIFIYFYLLFQI